MRSYGHLLYDESLAMLDDRFDKKYIVEYKVTDVFATRINAFCDVLQEIWDKPQGALGATGSLPGPIGPSMVPRWSS